VKVARTISTLCTEVMSGHVRGMARSDLSGGAQQGCRQLPSEVGIDYRHRRPAEQPHSDVRQPGAPVRSEVRV